jgi:hypothetical protein
MHLPQVHNNIFKNNFLTKYIIMNLWQLSAFVG